MELCTKATRRRSRWSTCRPLLGHRAPNFRLYLQFSTVSGTSPLSHSPYLYPIMPMGQDRDADRVRRGAGSGPQDSRRRVAEETKIV